MVDILPYYAFKEKRGKIASPCGASPANALAKELRIVFERREEFSLFGDLNGNLPAMIVQIAGNEVVVISSYQRDGAKELLVLKTVNELPTLDNAGADRKGTARETGDATINVCRGRNLETPTLQIDGAQEFPHVRIGGALKSL